MTILSGVKLKLYPNKTQKQTIEQTFGNSRFVWNQFKNMQENRYNAMIDDYNHYKEQAKKNGEKIINPVYIDAYDQSLNHVNIVVKHLQVNHKSKNQEKQVSILQALVMFMYQN